ncbi:class Ib ribonucleoside-diphosphate reductase assembly flavoprotein NrdI [Macrococcus bovicus]|uniref:Protein NrdI n=1 Tax=Macrococcus bovicus TaxID=69968 RepID=A0A4R6C0T4_9STAP|nr:class Ib ribonucleoside-diphosphate reductase assembly flavoprotein NrdI [Macrococcus bovicus]TDM14666.1 class Ib ribonucleoside-diphosphate reductase assembly flavoprotein NrdI [Macrococcus bovicus]WJP98289.1 class Ib ribonucleoside-diphosphate reductase assembly flavoprotein NrdI [Macrococcus bovicus]
MKIVYYSLTGNVRRFLQKSNFTGESLLDIQTIEEPFIVVTGTIGFGEVPDPVRQFLNRNSRYLVAVASSGNRNWGQNFARSGDLIAAEYHVPLLMKFELHGNAHDVQLFNEKVDEVNESLRRQTVQSY